MPVRGFRSDLCRGWCYANCWLMFELTLGFLKFLLLSNLYL